MQTSEIAKVNKGNYVYVYHPLESASQATSFVMSLLYHDLLDTTATALSNMEVELGVLRGSVVVDTAVVGTVVVGTAVVLIDSSYLYLQEPYLSVEQNQVAEQ